VTDYHDGAQDGYRTGYNQALQDVVNMIELEFPDPNPLSTLFTPYIGYDIVKEIESMRKG
jgi:hypothetical protein